MVPYLRCDPQALPCLELFTLQRFTPPPHRAVLPRSARPANASQVLLVGGATRMPAVCRFLANMTGIEAEEAAVDVDEAVALGAAVQVGAT